MSTRHLSAQGFQSSLSHVINRTPPPQMIALLASIKASVTMKTSLLQYLVSPYGQAVLALVSILTLVLIHLPQADTVGRVHDNRDEFPGRRRGGGTHWIMPGPAGSDECGQTLSSQCSTDYHRVIG
ncbi:MAG TPA: hypothetical protein IGS37_08530 [Synechococcales cyanobacterium M55_K2018_004]|nr:hypothetical protein [Synechococcales cyanobacterium M55_K2018_004]